MENYFEKVPLIKKYPNIWKWRDTDRNMIICAQTTVDEMIKAHIEQYKEMGYDVLDLCANKSKRDIDKVENVFAHVHFLTRKRETDLDEKNDIPIKENDVALDIVKQLINDMQGRYIVDLVVLSAKDREEINVKVGMFETWRQLVSQHLYDNRLIEELYEPKSKDEIEGMSLKEILELRDMYLGRGSWYDKENQE
ncbi:MULTISPECIES: hypothetical protein [Brevibacillus]|uniref:hypothetical protein n=1 Tax=Brevibacillus TaxID=55080 RepID=UPI00175A2432|nr:MULTISPECIES: hypothetical protein [Brevibacillus]MDR9507576.1 hypothetical protein [Brevibacillus agri]WNF05530.1 hypothetical protein RFB14_24910 [Brevibacillus borstelensis]HAJ4019658.1 hypothetical protein [Escherichia coli]